MSWLGNVQDGDTIDFLFTTRNTSGQPTQLAGTPAIQVYDANVTAAVAGGGETLEVDFAGVTGLNRVSIDTSLSGGSYVAGNDYSVVISSGTVGGTSVVGEVVGQFSVENRTATVTAINGLAPPVNWNNLSIETDGSIASVTLVDTVTTTTNTTTVGGLSPPANWNNLSIETDGSIASVTLVDTVTTTTNTTTVGGLAPPTNWNNLSIETDGSIASVTTVDAVTTLNGVSAATANTIADHTIRRNYGNARASSDGDTADYRSMLGLMARHVNRVDINSDNTMDIYHESDTTIFETSVLSTLAGADPVVGINPSGP